MFVNHQKDSFALLRQIVSINYSGYNVNFFNNQIPFSNINLIKISFSSERNDDIQRYINLIFHTTI